MVISKVLNKTPAMLTIILIETLAAEIMTLPLVMMIFGQMSIVALPANLLIVPLVPVAMLVAAVAAIAGAALPEAAGWLAWPANLLLTYILDLVRLLSGVPKAIVHIKIDSTLMICAYTSALIIMWTVQRRSKIKAVLIK
jgi:competence protein ComEC